MPLACITICSDLKAVTDDGKITALLVTEKKNSEENQFIEVTSILTVHVFK